MSISTLKIKDEYEELKQKDFSSISETNGFIDSSSIIGFKLIINKMRMKKYQSFLIGLIGGLIIGFGVLCGIGVILSLPEKYQNGLGMLLFSIIFASCMTLIVFAGGGLFTTYVVSTLVVMKKVITKKQYFQGIFLVLLGNAAGTLLIILLIYCLPLSNFSFFKDSAQTLFAKAYEFALAKMYYLYDQKTKTFNVTTTKVILAIIAAFVSGVLCNLMVSATSFIANCSKNGIIVIFAIFLPFFFFQYLGFHQAPTNTLFIWIMLLENIFHLSTNINVIGGVQWNQFILFTFILWTAALLGNWFSGAFSWTLIFYFLNYQRVNLVFQSERLKHLESILKKEIVSK